MSEPRTAPPTDGPAPSPPPGGRLPADEPSIVDLIRDLTRDGRELMRKEVELAKAELSEKIEVYQRNAVSMAIGGALAFAALLFFLWAVAMALTALFTLFMDETIAIWLAPLILAVVIGGIGYTMIRTGADNMKEEGAVPEKTVETMRANTNWTKRKVDHG